MKRNYLADKSDKKQAAKEAFWILLIFIIVFMAIITRFAMRSVFSNGIFKAMPSGEEAYKMAKFYIKPTLLSGDAAFADNDYKYARDTDSVYVVKSYFESKDSADVKVKTNYTIKLKYIGGKNSEEQSWSMLSLEEH